MNEPENDVAKSVGRCFVIMPFQDDFDSVYRTVIKPTLESPPLGIRCTRADEIFTPTSIIEDIRRSIQTAQFLIADLTGRNPNVLYELGFAHGIGRAAILLTRDITDVPFDLRHLRLARYDDNAAGLQRLRESLLAMVPELMRELRLPTDVVFSASSALPSEIDRELGSLDREQHRLSDALRFLEVTGRPVESIRTYDELREACRDSGHEPESRWQITFGYLHSLPDPVPEETILNVLVPMAFLGGQREWEMAREILLRQGAEGPFVLRPEWLDHELRYRQDRVKDLKQGIERALSSPGRRHDGGPG